MPGRQKEMVDSSQKRESCLFGRLLLPSCRLRVVCIFVPEEQNDRDDRDIDDDCKKLENCCHVALCFHNSNSECKGVPLEIRAAGRR